MQLAALLATRVVGYVAMNVASITSEGELYGHA